MSASGPGDPPVLPSGDPGASSTGPTGSRVVMAESQGAVGRAVDPGGLAGHASDDAAPPGPGRYPNPLASAEGRMILLFDLLWMAAAVPIYGVPTAAAVVFVERMHLVFGLPGAALSAPLAYLLFLGVLVLTLGAVRLVIPREEAGTSRVFADRAFFVFLLHWGLEHFLPRPLLTHVHLLTLLRTTHYRLQGAQIGWSTHLSPGAQVWSPSHLRFGHLCYVGEHAHVTAHLSLGDKLLVAPVSLGDHTNVGAHVHIGPGCTIGHRVRIGALCDIAPGVEIGDGAEIGPRSVLAMGARVGAGAVLEPRTFIDVYGTVPAGERWGGDPAHRLGEAPVRPKRKGRAGRP